MVRIEADPDEMKRYEGALRELMSELRASRNDMERAVSDVRSFWDDVKYRKFEKRMEQLFIEIQIFTKTGERYCEYLRRKAAALDFYLDG